MEPVGNAPAPAAASTAEAMSRTRLGFLYPGHSGESDYLVAAAGLDPVEVRVEHTAVPIDVHDEAAARQTGREQELHAGIRGLRDWDPDVVFFACTCASFVFGLEGARSQAASLRAAAGVPASSTSLAFVDALAACGVSRAVVAATYPAPLTALFVDFLEEAGVEVAGVQSLGIVTAGEVASVDVAEIAGAVRGVDRPGAQAILLPDTALPSLRWLEEVERDSGKLLLTANQVSLWSALRLADDTTPRSGFGRLLAEA